MGRVECGAVYAGLKNFFLKKIPNLELFSPGQRFDSLNLLTPVFQVFYDASRHLVVIHGTQQSGNLKGTFTECEKGRWEPR